MPVPSTDIVGSWFPSGYYGHVRNKPRSDFECEYRQLAKPPIPYKFISRSLQQDTHHAFSFHDNRHCFKSDAAFFEQGVGRRRHPEKSASFNPDFYTWMPLQKEISRSLPHISTYQDNYTHNGVKQLLVSKPKTPFEGTPNTTYQYRYGERGPNIKEIRQRAGQAMHLTTFSRGYAGRRVAPHRRETVASCLNWYRCKKSTTDLICRSSTDLINMPHVPTPPQSPSQRMVNSQMTSLEATDPQTFFSQSSPASSQNETSQMVSASTPPAAAPQQELLAA